MVVEVTVAPSSKAILLFWAPWNEASIEGGPMDQVLRALSSTSSDSMVFGRVHAEDVPELSEMYGVNVVPTFVLTDAKGNLFEKIEGGDDIARVTQCAQLLMNRNAKEETERAPVTPPSEEERLNKRLSKLVRASEVMLFMKGEPKAPKCGFSRQAVELLEGSSILFGSFDILSDESVRQGLKKFSDWPTYPQLYVKGELMGGLDILKDMSTEGNLKGQIGISDSQAPVEQLDDRLARLVKRDKVMLFMKGLPSAPKCGFSRQIVEILEASKVNFDSFDILQDEEVRQGLKKFSDWPTYPQLYANGELVGGLDIVQEMHTDGSLKSTLEA